jgi:putative transposase
LYRLAEGHIHLYPIALL